MRQIVILLTVVLAGCATSRYEFDQQRANARLKRTHVPIERTEQWERWDRFVDLLPKKDNLPHHKDLAGRIVQPPQIVNAGTPVFPPDLIYSRQQGDVLVLVIISTDGKVIDARIARSTNPLLNRAAVACAARWKFSPATVDGKPVNWPLRIPFDFVVGRKP